MKAIYMSVIILVQFTMIFHGSLELLCLQKQKFEWQDLTQRDLSNMLLTLEVN